MVVPAGAAPCRQGDLPLCTHRGRPRRRRRQPGRGTPDRAAGVSRRAGMHRRRCGDERTLACRVRAVAAGAVDACPAAAAAARSAERVRAGRAQPGVPRSRSSGSGNACASMAWRNGANTRGQRSLTAAPAAVLSRSSRNACRAIRRSAAGPSPSSARSSAVRAKPYIALTAGRSAGGHNHDATGKFS
jgi:hypothetical protein